MPLAAMIENTAITYGIGNRKRERDAAKQQERRVTRSMARSMQTKLEDLPDLLVICHILPFIGPYAYRFTAGINRRFRHLYRQYLLQRLTVKNHDFDGSHAVLHVLADDGETLECWTSEHYSISYLSTTKIFLSESEATKQNKCIFLAAAAAENLVVLEHLKECGYCYHSKTVPFLIDKGLLKVEVLAWFVANRYKLNIKYCIFLATKRGQLELLVWLYDNGKFPDNLTVPLRQLSLQCPIHALAAFGGHLETIKWFCDTIEERWDPLVSYYAAIGGHLEILKWAQSNDHPFDREVCRETAEINGYAHIVEWCNDNDRAQDSDI